MQRDYSMMTNAARNLALLLALAAPAWAQYPGHIGNTAKKAAPSLRSVAVVEWTGEVGKPSATRIIPISVFDGEEYQPGGLYLAKPEPLALQPGTEYVLQDAGVAKGLFDINNAQDVQGYWFGYGAWRPMAAAPKRRPPKQGKNTHEVTDSDGKPHFKGSSPNSSSSSSGSSSSDSSSTNNSSSSGNQSSSDPDRPTLRRRADSSDSNSSSSSSSNTQSDNTQSSGGTTASNSAPASDPDRPTLQRHAGSSSSSSSGSSNTNGPSPETALGGADPDRPHMMHGQQTPKDEYQAKELTGTPSDLQQMIAVSDANEGEPHPFVYLWADPGDATKMQQAMETAASSAVAATEPPAKAPAKPHTTTTTTTTTQRRKAATTPPPAPTYKFTNERFKAYELTYSGGATLVYYGETLNHAGKVKYVTLIAQPDFNGVPKVVFKSVTDDDHLDLTPKMRLVDAVDAKASNRGDLVFELRSSRDREFVIYRVSGGQAEQVFTTGSLPISHS
jgi:hypothetical protein